VFFVCYNYEYMSKHSYVVPIQDWANKTASVFKILADPTRCRILKILMQHPEGLCVGEIAEAVAITHSAASHQLTGLEARGILICVREGQTRCYTLANTDLAKNIIRILEIIF